jgi:hypothetical protein
MKKILFVILLLIVIAVIFAFSPQASGIYESICIKQLNDKYNIEAAFDSFEVRGLKQINCTEVILNKKENQIQAQEVQVKIIRLRPLADYFEIRLDSKGLEIADLDGNILPLASVITKQTHSDVLKSTKLKHLNFNLRKDKDKIKVYDIDAVGEKIKVYGSVDVLQNRGVCNLTIHVPKEKADEMPEFSKALSKVLFNMEQEGDWMIFNLTNIPFKM